mgnify:FL=1
MTNNKPSTSLKWLKRIGIAVAAFFGLFLLASIAMAIFGDPAPVHSGTPATSAVAEVPQPAPAPKYLAGMDSGELSAALKKRGFTVDHQYNGGYNTWMAQGADPGLSYAVNYGSDAVGKVESLSAQVMVDPAHKDIVAGMPFIGMVAAAPFAEADAKRVGEWIEANFSTMGTHVDTVATVEVTLAAPSTILRMVTLRPVAM